MVIYTRYLRYTTEKDVETRKHPNIVFKEMDRARIEQNGINYFRSYIYIMYVKQLVHKEGMKENNNV